MSGRLVVIGSNSFSGSHLVARALEEGIEVAGISRSAEPDPVFLPYRWNGTPKGFAFHRYDLNRDLDAIAAMIRRFRPQAVVNFAAQGMVAESWQHPEHWMRTNLVATVGLHQRLRQMDFLEKYVHASTPEVYGHCAGTVVENTAYAPSSPYAVSKAAIDMSLMTFFRHYRFPVVFTRAANVYGPGQQLYRIVPKTILSALCRRKLPLQGGGQARRGFLHIRDMADATLMLARQGRAGEIYHLAPEETPAIRALVARILDRLGVAFSEVVAETDPRPGQDPVYRLDTTKIRRELGWQDTRTLDQGLGETIAWVRRHLDRFRKLPWRYLHKA